MKNTFHGKTNMNLIGKTNKNCNNHKSYLVTPQLEWKERKWCIQSIHIPFKWNKVKIMILAGWWLLRYYKINRIENEYDCSSSSRDSSSLRNSSYRSSNSNTSWVIYENMYKAPIWRRLIYLLPHRNYNNTSDVCNFTVIPLNDFVTGTRGLWMVFRILYEFSVCFQIFLFIWGMCILQLEKFMNNTLEHELLEQIVLEFLQMLLRTWFGLFFVVVEKRTSRWKKRPSHYWLVTHQ